MPEALGRTVRTLEGNGDPPDFGSMRPSRIGIPRLAIFQHSLPDLTGTAILLILQPSGSARKAVKQQSNKEIK